MNDLDEIYFLKTAYEYAAEFSTDPSTQNGAVLVKDGNMVVAAANHFPRNIKESPERWERPLKYSYVEHAERNAIYLAAKKGIGTEGVTMYCPWFACDNCARAIIQSGISEVVGLQRPNDLTPDHWKDSIKVAIDMLTESGIKMRWIPGRVGVKLRFNSEIVEM